MTRDTHDGVIPDIPVEASPAGRTRLRWWIPYSILAVSLCLTGAASYDLASTTEAKERLRFRTEVEKTQESIESRLETYVAMLRATAGLFATSRSITRDEFHAFVTRLELSRGYPGIQGLGFTGVVPARERDAVVARMRRVDRSFRIWPEEPREEYHAILYLEPLDRRNQAAIGYDMFTEPVRRTAMERARDTGLPAASARVTLVQELDAQKQAGFLIYVPVYDTPTAPQTVEERRAHVAGFAYGAFRADDLLAAIFGGEIRPDLAFDVFAGREPSTGALLHRSHAAGRSAAPRFSTTRSFDVAGTPWSLTFSTLPAADAASGRAQFAGVMAVGLATSAALFFVTRSQVRARAAAERVASDLRRSEDALRELSEELERRVVQRTAELEAAREELVRKERLAVLGQLAGGVSHELRNPLGVMGNAVYYLRMVVRDDERVHKHLKILEREVATANRIVGDLLDYARLKPAARVPTDLGPLVRGALERLRIPETVKVTLALDAALDPVAADPGQVEQILSNLITNAIQAMPDGGTLTIATLRMDGRAQVAVSDTGVGIPPENMGKLFQPLFTTKARGIGLGLAIVKALVESNGATIAVETAVGRGSRFTVRFGETA